MEGESPFKLASEGALKDNFIFGSVWSVLAEEWSGLELEWVSLIFLIMSGLSSFLDGEGLSDERRVCPPACEALLFDFLVLQCSQCHSPVWGSFHS
jgi:hypothetical protein